MIPQKTIEELIFKHSLLEKELSAGDVDKKLFAEKSKEYSDLNDVIDDAKRYSSYEREKHDHVELVLSNKKRLIYNDPRRFGVMLFSKQEDDYFDGKNHGAEPLSKNYNFKYLKEKLKNKKGPMKSVLMDQAVVLGIGNIYVAETLHKCGVSPLRPSNKVNDDELKLIVKQSKLVLRQAIKAGGSTIKDFKKAGGESGYFQTKLLVYGREGQLCRKCHTPIENVKLSGRSSFWCPGCQG